MVYKVGLDIGNKNIKVSGESGEHEIAAAYREMDKYWYFNEPIGDNMEKVKYKDHFFLVGAQGKSGLPQNKGEINVREIANMFKLVGLARELRRLRESNGEFYLVSGTPLNDYEANKSDYLDLMLSDSSELIELDHVEYNINVTKADIVKQAAIVAPTLKNWQNENLILIDFGGGTLDIAYFIRGTKNRYLTIDFPLNELLEELGNTLNGHRLGLPRPDELDSGFLLTMEEVILTGKFMGVKTICVEGVDVSIQDFCNEWLQTRVDFVIEDVKTRLNLSDNMCRGLKAHYLGGGAKLLREQLINNKTFENKSITDAPMFDNVIAYKTFADLRWKNATKQ